MEEAMQKADVLIEALQWIRQFRGKITVIKLGGSVMEDPKAMIHLLVDLNPDRSPTYADLMTAAQLRNQRLY